ncbi:hypothetical protein [Streptacidiphilus monticola]|jgi:hypothetical protein|uniref:RDD domain-containing protein n=1 Tax=Streptacidiphilus monticola TaxID=2161674 RepID=A0ABW1G878_9ACTN
MDFLITLYFVYLLGIPTGGYGVFFFRAGLMGANPLRRGIDWRVFLLPNIPYFALTVAKSFVWPVVLVTWLATGRRPSPWIATTEYEGREVRAVLRRDRAVAAGLLAE